MSAYLAVHKRGLSSSDEEGSLREDSEHGAHLSCEKTDKLLTSREGKLFMKSKGKAKEAHGGKNQGAKRVIKVESPDSDRPPSPTDKIKRAARAAQRLVRNMSETLKRTSDPTLELPLKPVEKT